MGVVAGEGYGCAGGGEWGEADCAGWGLGVGFFHGEVGLVVVVIQGLLC